MTPHPGPHGPSPALRQNLPVCLLAPLSLPPDDDDNSEGDIDDDEVTVIHPTTPTASPPAVVRCPPLRRSLGVITLGLHLVPLFSVVPRLQAPLVPPSPALLIAPVEALVVHETVVSS